MLPTASEFRVIFSQHHQFLWQCSHNALLIVNIRHASEDLREGMQRLEAEARNKQGAEKAL